MDPRLLRHYNDELRYLRDMGGEFAREFPKIAARLAMDENDCADPYVERLLEGFAFLAARIQLEATSQYPRFTQNLLQTLYPNYFVPMPAMAVVQFEPDLREAGLARGQVLPRQTALKTAVTGKGGGSQCEYRTGHDVRLYPLRITEAQYIPTAAALSASGLPAPREAKAGIRISFEVTAGVNACQLQLDQLPIFLGTTAQLAKSLHEQLHADSLGVIVRGKAPGSMPHVLGRDAIQRMGYEDSEALLPVGYRWFGGFRLLQEYITLPERFLFTAFSGLQAALSSIEGNRFDIVVLLDRSVPGIEANLDARAFRLFCTPIINLFPRRADRVHIEAGVTEYGVVPDRTRTLDFEVFEVRGVEGFGSGAAAETVFQPFYGGTNLTAHEPHQAFFSVNRRPRVLSAKERLQGSRTNYIGSEVFVQLVDPTEAPMSVKLRQLSIDTLCTNRDLPLLQPLGKGQTDFSLDVSAPVESVRVLVGPSKPRSAPPPGEAPWRLISMLGLNFTSLLDDVRSGAPAAGLKELLQLFIDPHDDISARQVEGLRSCVSRSIVARVPVAGPLTFARGAEVTLTCEDQAFEGSGAFLLGAVLDEFFARYVSINSFTQLVLRSTERGEVMRWPVRTGRRPVV
ncbi:MAG: type VI secretion system baseplate subunit TssF [Gammaproteobacteria bacterium]|nr:type VI secretion system baseplate subunit TssF [Gammaproteobacteria bacterium]